MVTCMNTSEDSKHIVTPVRLLAAAALTSAAMERVESSASTPCDQSAELFIETGTQLVGHGAIGFRKEDKDLYEAFNAELKKFIGSPEHIALVTPFGFGKGFLPTKTTEELCAGK